MDNDNDKIIRKETDYFAIKDGSEDGLDVEETRYYSGTSYDDNLNFIGYNADLRDTKTGRMVAVVDFNEGDDDFRVRLCQHCEEFGFQYKLGVLTVSKGEKRPADWENWLQCHQCWTKYGRFEIIAQKTLKMNTERHEEANPFDAKKGIVLGIPNRTSKEGKLISARKRRERQRAHHKDSEIDELLRIYGEENVRIIYDSDHN